MSKILNFNKLKPEVSKNKEFAKECVEKIESILEEDLKKEYDQIENYENKNNFEFLMNNFQNINTVFKKSGVSPKDLQLISNKLRFILKDEDYSLSRIYIILCFYNALRIYKNDFIMISDDYTSLITSLFISFEQSYDIIKLDNISAFIFNEEIMQELKSITLSYEELFRRCESIVDAYLNSDISAPVEYFAKKEIEFIKSSNKEIENYGPGFLGYGIRTPEFIGRKLEEQLDKMSFIFLNNEDKYFNIKSDIEMVAFKIKNMNEGNKKRFYDILNKIDVDENINAIEKLEKILNIIDVLYNTSISIESENINNDRKIK